ncbi:hypothetical protein HDU93_001760, partial [Gonapodya sp. JEL0774]
MSSKAPADDIVGILGRPEWAAQRGWGYKHIRVDPGMMSIRYGPREKDLGKNKGAGKIGVLTFTIFFTTVPIYSSAAETYTLKTDDLQPSTFRSHFVDSLHKIVDTEWACIAPPAESRIVPTTGNLSIGYICKPVGEPLGEKAKQRVVAWATANLSKGGDW